MHVHKDKNTKNKYELQKQNYGKAQTRAHTTDTDIGIDRHGAPKWIKKTSKRKSKCGPY